MLFVANNDAKSPVLHYSSYPLQSIVRTMQEQNYSELNNRVNSIVCFLCGREFGTRGFAFHHKECRVKFQNEQTQRNPKDRSKAPEAPEGLSFVLEGQFSKLDLKKFNAQSNEIHKYKVLPSCKYCARTFNYDSLLTHMKGCDRQKDYKEEKENHPEAKLKTPKNLVCCVCGQRFGTQSLRIHYPECIKKFTDDEFRKHKREADRRKPPQFNAEDELLIKNKTAWTDQELENFNNRATEMYRDKAMAECFNCKRKFFDEQLQKHQKNCVLINGTLNAPEKAEKRETEARKPRTIMCVICGREFGHASIAIHAERCSELYLKQQELKPKAERRQLPEIPEEDRQQYELAQAESWPMEKIEAYNKLVSNIYNTKSLAKCYICHRTFFEESLAKHIRGCETNIKDVRKLEKFKKEVRSKSGLGDHFIEEVMQINRDLNKVAEKSTAKPKTLMCFLCGRDYGLSSLKIHLPQCKQKPTNSKKLQDPNFQSVCQAIEAKYTFSESEGWSQAEIEAYNQQVYGIYKKESLFECQYCHRTFFEESLKKHIKHCEKEKERKTKIRRTQTMKDLKHEEPTNIDQSQVDKASLAFISEEECRSNEDATEPAEQESLQLEPKSLEKQMASVETTQI